jgi:hypothetical protein
MAVGRLSGAWIHQVVTEAFPAGVVRRALLDHFSVLLVSKKSSRGARGRLARKLYTRLLSLQRRGLIVHEDGVIRAIGLSKKVPLEAQPIPGPALARLLFRAMLAEDGQGDGHTVADLRATRRDFISQSVESGWTVEQAAQTLGIKAKDARSLLSGGRLGQLLRTLREGVWWGLDNGWTGRCGNRNSTLFTPQPDQEHGKGSTQPGGEADRLRQWHPLRG